MIRSITFLITVVVTGVGSGALFAQNLNSTHSTTSVPVESFRSAVPMRTVSTAQNEGGARSPWQPRLGLVLSGGGARGLAQIGVLRALEEAGIRPDLIVGTSIGSIIGGLYAGGYNARRLQQTVRDIEWNKVMRMRDAADRNFLSLDQKPISDRSILTLRFDGLQPILPQAVSNGQRLTNLLNELTLQALYHADDFDNLGIPFRAVATDLQSGKSVTLSGGGLAECMRASSTLPVMYSPVHRDSMLLVDGGLLANIPVDVARAEGCEFILVVNTTSPLRDGDKLSTAFDVIDQVFNIVMIPAGEEQLAQADMVIAPDLRHVDGMDFSKADSLIAIGYAAAKEHVNVLREELNAMAVRCMPRPEHAHSLYHLRSIPDGIAYSAWYDRPHDIDALYSKAVQIANEGKHADVEVLLHSDATAEIVFSPLPRVTSINVVGNTLLSRAVVAGLESRWIGTPINEWTQRGISEYLLEDYRKHGYSLARVDSLRISPDGAIHLRVTEGVVERISVRGNTRTNHVVILREISVRTGKVFRMTDMKRSMENLFALDLFHSVAYDIVRDDDQIHLVVRVVERPSKILQTGLLVDNERNAQLGLLLRDANFLGSGTEIAASFFGGHDIREYAVQFSSNRLFYTPFNARIRAFYGFRDYNEYTDVPDLSNHRFDRDIALVYRHIGYGAAAAIGMYVQRFGHLQGKLRYTQQSIRTDQLRNPDAKPINEEHRLVEWGVSSTVDTQDRFPYPNTGILFEGEYTSALKALGSEIAFTRLTLGYDFYVPVIPDHLVLHPRIRFGYGDKTMPRTEEFRIGGLYSFIGMRENEYNGRQIILGGMELRYALPVRILFDTYLSLRYDLGRTWANPELIKLEDLRHGIGLQLGLDTPIGPADFAVGRSFYFLRANPVTPVKLGPVHLYFTIGARL